MSKLVPVLSRGVVVDYAIVDDEDYDRVVSVGTWRMHSDGYAQVRRGDKTILMHRVVTGVTDSNVHVDHWNHVKLDNRKENLRPGSQADNNANPTPLPRSDSSSRFKGVGRFRGGWRAQGWANGKNVWLGKFSTEEAAAVAYKEWKDSK